MVFKWLDRRIAAPGPYLTLVFSQGEFDAALKRLKVPAGAGYLSTEQADATTHIVTSPRSGIAAVVALGPSSGRSPIEVAGLLVHEAVHIWQHYCDWIGGRDPGDEQEAYAVQAISQELMAEYSRRVTKGTLP